MNIKDLNEVECHTKWFAKFDIIEERVKKVLDDLESEKSDSPWLSDLYLLLKANLRTMPMFCDLGKAWKLLSETEREVPALINVQFLVKATKLRLMEMESRPGSPSGQTYDEAKQYLEDFSAHELTKATCLVVKCWTMRWFAVGPHRKAIIKDCEYALQDAKQILDTTKKIPENPESQAVKFLCLYNLALVLNEQRNEKLFICREELQHWEEAKSILDEQKWQDVMFLADFARAVASTPTHSKLCKNLLKATEDWTETTRTNRTDGNENRSKPYRMYIALPEVYSTLIRRLNRMGKDKNEVETFSEKIRSILEQGNEIEKCRNHPSFIAAKVGQFLFDSRVNEAEDLLNESIFGNEYWLELKRIQVLLRKPKEDVDIQSSLRLFETLCTNFPNKEAIIRMDKGIFLLKHGDVKRGMENLIWANNDYLHPAYRNNGFIMQYLREIQAAVAEEEHYLIWIESQFETDSETYHVGKSIKKYQNYQPLSDEQKHFVNEHLGRLLMRKSQFEEAEQLFRSLPESVQHRTAMIADSLLCQAESLSSGDDVKEVCKDKLAKMQAESLSSGDDVNEVCKDKLAKMQAESLSSGDDVNEVWKDKLPNKMRLHLLNECASLGCKDSVHEALLLLEEDIRKQSDRNNVLQVNADPLFLHSTCVYEFCARLTELKNAGFHIKRRRTAPEDEEGITEKMSDLLKKVKEILCQQSYPRKLRLKMTRLILKESQEKDVYWRSMWLTLDELRKELDRIWHDFIAAARNNPINKKVDVSCWKCPVYYPLTHDQRNANTSAEKALEGKWKLSYNKKENRKFDDNPDVQFPLAPRSTHYIFKWMAQKETAIGENGNWLELWSSKINQDKHKTAVELRKLNSDIEKKFQESNTRKGPANLQQLAHFAAEFVEEVRFVLLSYKYKEVSGFPMKFEALKSDYDWKWACYKCATGFDALRSRFEEPSEQCTDCQQVILLVRDKNAVSGSKWQHIRPRRRKLIKLEMCFKYSDIPDCNECMRAHCDSAHGEAEYRLWELERIGKFSFNRFMKQHRNAQTELPLVICERAGESGVRQIFYTGPPGPPETQTLARLPPTETKNNRFARLCEKFSRGIPCPFWRDGKCYYAHCAEEEQLWNIMKKPREDWPAGLRELIDKIKPGLTGWILQFHCDWKLVCYKCANSSDALQSKFSMNAATTECKNCEQCFLLVREKSSAVSNEWQRVRLKMRNLSKCHNYGRRGECRYSDCDFAHGDLELKMWQLERTQKFSFDQFLKDNRTAASELPLILRELPAGSASRIVYAGPEQRPARLPPPKCNKAQLCKSIFEKEDCRYRNNCNFAHCAEEEQLWNIMKSRGDIPSALQALIKKLEETTSRNSDSRLQENCTAGSSYTRQVAAPSQPNAQSSNSGSSASQSTRIKKRATDCGDKKGVKRSQERPQESKKAQNRFQALSDDAEG